MVTPSYTHTYTLNGQPEDTLMSSALHRQLFPIIAAGATIEDGKVTLVIGEPTADTSSEWDEALNRDKR